MSQTVPGAVPLNRPTNSDGQTVKRKRTRSPSVAKPAFIILQLLDEDDQPMQFDKRRVRILAVERNAEKVLEAVDKGEHPNAFYLRVTVPAGSRAGSPNRPKEAAAA